MKQLIVIILVIVAGILSFLLGRQLAIEVSEAFPIEITLEEKARVIEILEEARYSHQYIVDHPEWQNASTGNTTFNLKWISNYDFLRDVFLKCGG